MNPKKNVFVVMTFYQLLTAVNIVIESFASTRHINIIYYFVKNDKGLKLKKHLSNFNGVLRTTNIADRLDLYRDLANTDIHRFIFFQENDIFNKYLAYCLSKLGTIIVLGPDGSKPYGVFTKRHEWLSMVRDTVRDYSVLVKNGMLLFSVIPSWYYRYGYSNIINEIWLQYPFLFNSELNKLGSNTILRLLPDLSTETIKALAEASGFEFAMLGIRDNPIVYFNQPFWSEELIEAEKRLVIDLCASFKNDIIYIKLHPSTQQNMIFYFQSFPSVVLLNPEVPSEFILVNLKGATLLTGWSASLMHNISRESNYYYIYPFFKRTGDRVLDQIEFISFTHIKIISSVDEMVRPTVQSNASGLPS